MHSRIATWDPPVPHRAHAPAPIAIGLSPTGPAVIIVEHVVPAATPMRCVSYRTRGLRDLGHDELVFTLRTDRRVDPDFVLEPIELFRMIHWRVTCGTRLRPGAVIGAPLARAVDWPGLTGFR